MATSGVKSGSDGVHIEETDVAADATCVLTTGHAASATRVQDIIVARGRATLKALMSDSGVGR